MIHDYVIYIWLILVFDFILCRNLKLEIELASYTLLKTMYRIKRNSASYCFKTSYNYLQKGHDVETTT